MKRLKFNSLQWIIAAGSLFFFCYAPVLGDIIPPGGPPIHHGPKLINVQGKLSDKTGKPLSGNYTVTFRLYQAITDPVTSAVWQDDQALVIQNGLFNATLGSNIVAPLNPITFDKPYYLGMQVVGDPNEMTPRQLLGASAYALGSLDDFNVAGKIVGNSDLSATGNISADGAISAAKDISTSGNISAAGNVAVTGNLSLNGKDVGSWLIPAGAVMLFAGDCPSGWSRFTALDNLFSMGAATYGATGGSATHNHSISADGTHSHGGLTGQGDTAQVSNAGSNFSNQAGWHRHSISLDGGHSHGGTAGTSSSLPPYRAVVFCQKQ